MLRDIHSFSLIHSSDLAASHPILHLDPHYPSYPLAATLHFDFYPHPILHFHILPPRYPPLQIPHLHLYDDDWLSESSEDFEEVEGSVGVRIPGLVVPLEGQGYKQGSGVV